MPTTRTTDGGGDSDEDTTRLLQNALRDKDPDRYIGLFHERCGLGLLKQFRRWLRGPLAAEHDAAYQETLIRVLVHLRRLKASNPAELERMAGDGRAVFFPRSVAHNVAVDLFRRHTARSKHHAEGIDPNTLGQNKHAPLDVVDAGDELDATLFLLDTVVTARERNVILAWVDHTRETGCEPTLQELTKAYCERTGIAQASPDSVRGLLRRGLKRLADHLAPAVPSDSGDGREPTGDHHARRRPGPDGEGGTSNGV